MDNPKKSMLAQVQRLNRQLNQGNKKQSLNFLHRNKKVVTGEIGPLGRT